MVRHRCTRCKEDVGEYGIRHKYVGGLFCEKCLRELGFLGTGIHNIVRGFWGGIWNVIAKVARSVAEIFRPKRMVKETATKAKLSYSVMKEKMRSIPPDARTISPQKR